MKGKGLFKKTFAVLTVLVIIGLSVVAIVLNKDQIITKSEIANNQETLDLMDSVWIDESYKDYASVFGRITVGGYGNGYCLNHGASLWGGRDSLYNSNRTTTPNITDASKQGQLNWLFDNMVRIGAGADENEFYIQNLKKIMSDNGKSTSWLDSPNYTQIYQVQQYAVWAYTNNISYSIPSWKGKANDGRADLYDALLKEAAKHSNYNLSSSNVTISSNNQLKIVQNGVDVLVGPINIENSQKKLYKLSYSDFTINGVTVKSAEKDVTLLASDKSTVLSSNNSKTYTNYSGDVYLKIANVSLKTEDDSYSLRITGKLSAISYNTIIKYWENGNIQPVATISRNSSPSEIEVNAKYISGDYKLSIIKCDDTKQPINLNGSNIFKATVNGTELSGTVNGSKVDYNTIKISEDNVGSNDTIVIEENIPLQGYIKYSKKIKLDIQKVYNSSLDKYIGQVQDIYIDDVKYEGTGKGGWIYDDGNVAVDWLDGQIYVKVINDRIIEGKYNLSINKKDTLDNGVADAKFTIKNIQKSSEGSLITSWKNVFYIKLMNFSIQVKLQ